MEGRGGGVIKFTDSNKWDDPWFEALPPWAQLLWMFVCDKCDHVGVLAMSKAQADRRIPGIDWGSLEAVFAGRMAQLGPDLWVLPKYLHFQQPNLDKNQNMQKAVTKLLDKHGLQFNGRLVTKRKEGGEGSPLVAPPKPLEGSHVTVTVPVPVEVPVSVDVKSQGQSNKAKLERELRMKGMAWKGDAFLEWKDMLVGTGVCTTFEWCQEILAHIAMSSRRQGTLAAYARQAMPYLDAAVAHVTKLQEQEHEESLQRNPQSSSASPACAGGVDHQDGAA